MNKRVKKIIEFVAIGITIALLEWLYFGFFQTDILVPYGYSGDALTGIVGIKELLTNGTTQLGWPYHIETYQYMAKYNLLYELFVRCCGLFTSNYILIFNLYILVIPWVNVITAYLVLKYLKINKCFSLFGALTFGFCPYVQCRLVVHNALAAVECIPLFFLLVIWLVEDERFLRFEKGWFKYKKNYISVLFSWMIANNGMVYYPVFDCLILFGVGLYLLNNKRRFSSIVPVMIQGGQILAWLAVGFLPTIYGALLGAGNVASNGAIRNALRATNYGLDIKALLLSPKGYGSEFVLQKYNYLLGVNNENLMAYMGIVAIIGLVLSLWYFLKNNTSDIYTSRVIFLSKINIIMILIGAINGLGVLIAIICPFISCYNRISPYIVFNSILILMLTMQRSALSKSNKVIKKKIVMCVLLIVMVYGMIEQQGIYRYETKEEMEQIKTSVNIDRKFFALLESVAGDGAMVFQLPYMKSFENGPTVDIPDYDHLKGYLYTKTIKWSYGMSYGTENDEWYSETAALDSDAMCEELRRQGFSGIYLNLNGYITEDREKILHELMTAANCTNMISDDTGTRVYISLEAY